MLVFLWASSGSALLCPRLGDCVKCLDCNSGPLLETSYTSKSSKQRRCFRVYTAALCGEARVTSRLCDGLSTQAHLRVPESHATNHNTRRHARMCRIGQITTFGTWRSVTASTPRHPQASATSFRDPLTYSFVECTASRPRRWRGYCSGTVSRPPLQRVWLTRQAPRLNVFEYREDGSRPGEAKWIFEEVS